MKLIHQVQQKRSGLMQGLSRWLRRTRARAIFWLVAARGRAAAFWVRHSWNLVLLVTLILAGISFVLLPWLDSYVYAYLRGAENIQTARTILATVGGALIGSAVIAFSLVMFAMQVNVERMPHGLFFRFSSDARIMLLFVGTFVTALGVVACALLPGPPRPPLWPFSWRGGEWS